MVMEGHLEVLEGILPVGKKRVQNDFVVFCKALDRIKNEVLLIVYKVDAERLFVQMEVDT